MEKSIMELGSMVVAITIPTTSKNEKEKGGVYCFSDELDDEKPTRNGREMIVKLIGSSRRDSGKVFSRHRPPAMVVNDSSSEIQGMKMAVCGVEHGGITKLYVCGWFTLSPEKGALPELCVWIGKGTQWPTMVHIEEEDKARVFSDFKS